MKNYKKWLKCAGVRAIKTVAQTAVSTIGVSAVMSEVNWLAVCSASLLAGILSLLTSISGLPEIKEDDLIDK
ncbi:MAG: holin [Oscillospiraceae bacterium]|nr:holin [Oscillospiraceae bacterium]